MKQVRANVFETNSSSTHSICISKTPVVAEGQFVKFGFDEYGWGDECVTDTASYLHTAIYEVYDKITAAEKIQMLKDILTSHGVKCAFEKPKWDKNYGWFESGYVDHGYELREFVEAVLNDYNLLMRLLFGDSCIYTGNDNSSDYDSMCWSAKEYTYDYDARCQIPNPNHDPEHYDYFFKGN